MQQQGLAKSSLQLRIEVTTGKKEIKVEQGDVSGEEFPSVPSNLSSRADKQPPTPHLGNWAEVASSLVDSTYAELQATMSTNNRNSDQSPVVKRNSKRRMRCEGEKEKEISAAGAKTFSISVRSVTRFLPPGSKKPPTASEVDDSEADGDEMLAARVLVKKARKQNNSQAQGQRRYR